MNKQANIKPRIIGRTVRLKPRALKNVKPKDGRSNYVNAKVVTQYGKFNDSLCLDREIGFSLYWDFDDIELVGEEQSNVSSYRPGDEILVKVIDYLSGLGITVTGPLYDPETYEVLKGEATYDGKAAVGYRRGLEKEKLWGFKGE